MPRDLPSVEYLHKILSYDPDTGKLYWKHRTPDMFTPSGKVSEQSICNRWNARHAQKPALKCLDKGYFTGRIKNKLFFAHRVLFAMHYGRWPVHGIDHINGDPKDNRICNLREADQTVNNRNASTPVTNKSGVVGVFWDKSRQRWAAAVSVGDKTVHLGRFLCFEDAVAARQAANFELGFHPNHGRTGKHESRPRVSILGHSEAKSP